MRERELSEKVNHDPKHVKMAIGIASDPRHKGGDYTGAHNKIEKIAKGLASHSQVAAVLKKNNESIKEGLGDLAHLAEQDHEVQMARAELYKLAKYAIKLHEMLKGISEREGLEGWVQSKITKSADMIGSVYHHLEYQESPMGEVTEAKDTHCSDKCCGSEVKREDCKCPPTCKHCNCNAVAESAEMARNAALDKASDSSKEGKKKVTLKKAPWEKDSKKKDETYKESLALKLENVQQQRKDDMFKSMSDAGAYNGGKSIPKQNKKSKPVKRSQADKDAGVAKMRDEDEAAKKAQRDRFAAIKKSADNKGK